MAFYAQKEKTYATAKVLTTSFVDIKADNVVDCSDFNELSVYLDYDPAVSGEIVDIRIDFSPDKTNWYPEADETVAAGVATIIAKTRQYTSTSGDSATLPVISVPVADRFVRIMAKDNVGTTGTLSAKTTLSKIGQ